jgi:hypothetical protein
MTSGNFIHSPEAMGVLKSAICPFKRLSRFSHSMDIRRVGSRQNDSSSVYLLTTPCTGLTLHLSAKFRRRPLPRPGLDPQLQFDFHLPRASLAAALDPAPAEKPTSSVFHGWSRAHSHDSIRLYRSIWNLMHDPDADGCLTTLRASKYPQHPTIYDSLGMFEI